MKNLKKAAALTMIAGGLVAAGAGAASATDGGAHAHGHATHSPGVASGNLVQVPVHVPVNVVGNSVNVVGLLNPAFGNTGVNH
ncbi:chaplin family protein [Streptomyces sp. SYSU K217416]